MAVVPCEVAASPPGAIIASVAGSDAPFKAKAWESRTAGFAAIVRPADYQGERPFVGRRAMAGYQLQWPSRHSPR